RSLRPRLVRAFAGRRERLAVHNGPVHEGDPVLPQRLRRRPLRPDRPPGAARVRRPGRVPAGPEGGRRRDRRRRPEGHAPPQHPRAPAAAGQGARRGRLREPVTLDHRGATPRRRPSYDEHMSFRRALGRLSLGSYRLAQRVWGKGFSLLAGGAFAEFGPRSVLQPPVRVAGEAGGAIGRGGWVRAGRRLPPAPPGGGG